MRWWSPIVGLVVGVGIAMAQSPAVREATTLSVDLHFDNAEGIPALPSTLRYGLFDKLSDKWLYGPLDHNPPDFPCPDGSAGCTTVTLPATAQVIVGRCRGVSQVRYCLNDTECPNNATCEAKADAPQTHVLSLSWAYPGGSAADRVAFDVTNLEYIPFPNTPTPTASYTATYTTTPTRTGTPTRTPTT